MMLIFTMNNAGGNAQEWHGKIGEHYGLPMVSFRDALWPEIEAGRLTWEDVEGDIVHPNDRGHQYMADFIAQVLGRLLDELPDDAELPERAPVPEPLISDIFERTSFGTANDVVPTANEGWELFDTWFGKGWKSSDPGAVLEFEISGTCVSLAYYRIKGDMGRARVMIDGEDAGVMEGWFEADWGGYCNFHEAKRGLAPGTHTVRIELLDEKAEASNGHEFQLWLAMGAGIQAE